MSDAWRPVFSKDTPWDELQDIIEEEIRAALHAWLDTLLDGAELTDRQRAQGWALGAPKIREQHRATLEAAWHRLQLEAAAPSGTVQ